MKKIIAPILVAGSILAPLGFSAYADNIELNNGYYYQLVIQDGNERKEINVTEEKPVVDFLSDKDFTMNSIKSDTDLEVIPKNGDVITVMFGYDDLKVSTENVPFRKIEEKTVDLPKGEKQIKQKGENGVAKVFLRDNIRTTQVTKKPIPEIMLVGTKEEEPEIVEEVSENAANEFRGSSSNNTRAENSGRGSSSTRKDSGRRSRTHVTRGYGLTSWSAKYADTSTKTIESIRAANPDNPITAKALEQVGKPYVWGKAGPDSMDCSGLVHYVLKSTGYNIGRTNARGFGAMSKNINNPADLIPGDILWNSGHIVMYVGKDSKGVDKIVHAANPRRGVVISDMSRFLRDGYRIGRLI